jgi:hypothetical protein
MRRRTQYRRLSTHWVAREVTESPVSDNTIGADERPTIEVRKMVPSDYDNYPQGWPRVRAALVDAVEARGGPPEDFPVQVSDLAATNSPSVQYALALEERWRASRFNDTAALKFVTEGVLSPREVGE